MANDVPTLTSKGWLREAQPKADALMAYYLTARRSQSTLAQNSVYSLPKHIQLYGNNPKELEANVQRDLQTYFSDHFDGVMCEVTTDIPSPADPNRLNLRIGITVMQDGVRYQVAHLIEVENNLVKTINRIMT